MEKLGEWKNIPLTIPTKYVATEYHNLFFGRQLGPIIMIRCWGAMFKANPAGQQFILDVPTSTIQNDAWLHEGGAGVVNTQGNLYITGGSILYAWIAKLNVRLYGVLIYMTKDWM